MFVTHAWEEAERLLGEGAKVLYMPPRADLDWSSPPLADVPVFWNRLMSPGWGRMLGTLVEKAHPALAGFPTASHHDWQWTELVAGARAMNLGRLPRALQPIVQPIDDWNRNYKLGLLFEARVGKGRLLVSSADLANRLDERVVARQLRRSVLDYMASEAFAPRVEVAAGEFRSALFDTRVMKKLGATASGWPNAANAIDGDPNSFALLGAPKDGPRPQDALTIAFPQAVPFDGLVLMPRQNHRDHEGDVRELSVQVSEDGQSWREVLRTHLESTFDPQTVRFGQAVSARQLRLLPLSGFGADRASAFADVDVSYTGPALPALASDMEYSRSRSASGDVDEAGMDDRRPRRDRKP